MTTLEHLEESLKTIRKHQADGFQPQSHSTEPIFDALPALIAAYLAWKEGR